MERKPAAAFPRLLWPVQAGSVQTGTLEVEGRENKRKANPTLAFNSAWSLWESSAAAFTTVETIPFGNSFS
jgi:hypothetical protein